MKRDEASDCGGCGSEERWVLHNIRHRGDYRRLCTSCVLKFHSGLFCPVCFEVYDSISAPSERVKCLKCSSASHMACVNEDLRSAYVCPCCSNPSSVIFDVGAMKKKSGDEDGDGVSVAAGNEGNIDLSKAKILVTAARIASISMSKAVTAARIEAERRVKEAAMSRKRAREALERVVYLGNKAKERIVIPSPVAVTEPKKKSKGYSAVTAAVAAQKRIQNQYRAMGNNKMGTVAVASNNVGLRKNEGLVRLNATNLVQRPSTKVVSTKKIGELKGCQQLQSPDTVTDKKSSNLAHLLNRVLQEDKDKNGLSSGPTTARQPQSPPLSDHDIEEERVNPKAFADSGGKPQVTNSNQDIMVSNTNT